MTTVRRLALCPLVLCSGTALAQPRADDQAPRPAASVASAASPAVALAWESDDAVAPCLDRNGFVQAVDGVAKRQVFSALAGAGVVLHVQLVRASTNYRAKLTLETSHGEALGNRELFGDATACDELVRALALAAVLAIDSLSAVVAPESASLPRPSPPERSERSPWRVEMTPRALLSWGRLPSPAPGFGLGAAVLPYPMWATEVAAYAWLAQRARDPLPTATISGWGAALSECVRVDLFARTQSRWCVGAEVNQTRGEPSSDLQQRQSPVSTWMAVRVGTGVSILLGRNISLRLDVDGVAPLARDDFRYTTSNGTDIVLFKPAAVDLDAALGLALAFP